MRKIFQILFLFIVSSYALSAQNLYSYNIEEESGSIVGLSKMQGSKLIVMITGGISDSSYKELATIYQQYPSVRFISLPMESLRQEASSGLDSLTGVVKGKRASDNNTTNGRLLQWLSRRVLNRHFEVSTLQVGYKFFIDEEGELYCVLPPSFQLSPGKLSIIINKNQAIQPAN
ncbi:hypothetical protein [Flavihumibacter sp. ZG627]|uniref:hypothetical protein n=1 Tax=Flavihumibacter sp. ZG627 TaxID=1463156 RepID=UPI00057CB0EA|nr:hypothetical protein [Flavihumibacter sp. ZG627]KIC89216.1 hypothetical protein HY58_18365 [Flavihumibacter sp. ZG627]